jgi:hypothetical protein
MNKTKAYIRFAFSLFLLCSCKKEVPSIVPLAALNLINVTVNLGTVKANYTNTATKGAGYQFYSQITTSVGYGANFIYGVLANTTVPLTVAPMTDTLAPAYSGTLNLVNGASYSLYLAGTLGSVDALLLRDTIVNYVDSSCGVRVINLSYNSNPIVITEPNTPTVDDFSNLGYKQISSFKTYPAGATNTSYVFQVRDAGTNAILGTYTLTSPIFHSVTLAWIGQTGGAGNNAPQIMRINNYY